MKVKIISCMMLVVMVVSIIAGAVIPSSISEGVLDVHTLSSDDRYDTSASYFTSSIDMLDVISVDENGVYDSEGNLIPVETEILINGAEGLNKFSDFFDGEGTLRLFTGYTVSLAADITFTENFTPIGSNPMDDDFFMNAPSTVTSISFDGTFDGKGHTISNMIINEVTSAITCAGLFRVLEENSTVKNVGIINSEISASGVLIFAGSIAGYTRGEILNCYTSADMQISPSSEGVVGGIVGSSEGDIIGCYNAGNISVTKSSAESRCVVILGGIAGSLSSSIECPIDATISNCYNAGTISVYVTAAYVGGLLGASASNIINCYNVGDIFVDATNMVVLGGITGYSSTRVNHNTDNIEARGCYNAGNMFITSECDVVSIGGIASVLSMKLLHCYNVGDISINPRCVSVYAGGIVGDMENYVGVNDYAIFISDTYNTGHIFYDGEYTEDVSIGGIVGYTERDILNSYCLEGVDTILVGNGGGMVLDASFKSAEEMKSEEFLSLLQSDGGWMQDTNNINDGYPVLKSLTASEEVKTHDYMWLYAIFIILALVIGIVLALSYNSKN